MVPWWTERSYLQIDFLGVSLIRKNGTICAMKGRFDNIHFLSDLSCLIVQATWRFYSEMVESIWFQIWLALNFIYIFNNNNFLFVYQYWSQFIVKWMIGESAKWGGSQVLNNNEIFLKDNNLVLFWSISLFTHCLSILWYFYDVFSSLIKEIFPNLQQTLTNMFKIGAVIFWQGFLINNCKV